MKTPFRISIPFYFLFIFICCFAFISATSKKVNEKQLFPNPSDTTSSNEDNEGGTPDSFTGEPEIFNTNDLSSAFNERGYMSSNSVSYDNKEIINDFNGNLMYQIPIWKSKGQGDLSFDVKLTYNGNVSYQVITSNKTSLSMVGGNYRMYNINAPGWIYSVNGFAVQMLNFESSFFTNPHGIGNNLYEVNGRDVHLLASGYQLTDNYNHAHAVTYKDKITIMLGDGSTMTLFNNNTNDQQFTAYTGWYKVAGKNNGTYAYVEYSHPNYWQDPINPPNPPEIPEGTLEAGTPRTMYLMQGDGLVYIFKEKKIIYHDLRESELSQFNAKFFPYAFHLVGIKDRFGHTQTIDYYAPGEAAMIPAEGRNWLKSVPGVYFKYLGMPGGNFIRIIAQTSDGEYIFNVDQFGNEIEKNHNSRLIDFINPSGEKIYFGYESYQRHGLNMYGAVQNSQSTQERPFTMNLGGNFTDMGPLYRLNLVREYKTQSTNGYVDRQYTYYNTNSGNLSVDYGGSSNTEVHSPISYYLGQGRDLFFSNMIGEAITIVNGSVYRSEGFTYGYEYIPHRGSDPETNVWDYPVDYRDNYTSTRTLYSNVSDEYTYNTPQSKSTSKLYKNYQESAHLKGELNNYSGSIKLMSDKYSVDEGATTFKEVKYTYEIINPSNQTSLAGGTFLDASIEEIYNGVSKKVRMWYEGGGFRNVKRKVEFDPLGKKTETIYNDSLFIGNYLVYKDGIYRFQFGVPINYETDTDSTRIYIANLPKEINVYAPDTVTVIQKATMEYIGLNGNPIPDVVNSTQIAPGYPGQLLNEKQIDPLNNSVLKETSLKYYNRDTTGQHLYPMQNFFGNKVEGNIKESVDPKGNKVKYYYNLVSRNEQENFYTSDCYLNPVIDEFNCAPKLSYHKLYDNGTDQMQLSSWSDGRFPSRIDRYVDNSRFLTTYQSYDGIGNPKAIVNENKYISEALYNKYYRLSSLTLPYDFNDEPLDTTRIPIQNTSQVEIVNIAHKWGNNDEFLPGGPVRTGLDWVGLHYDYTDDLQPIDPNEENPPYRVKANPYFEFDTTGMYKVTSAVNIDSAFIEFAPDYVSLKVDNQNSTNCIMRILPAKVLNESGNVWNFEYGNGSISTAPIISALPDCSTDQSVEEQYRNNYRRIDAKNLLSQNFENNRLRIQGIKFDFTYTGASTNPHINYWMTFWSCQKPEANHYLRNYGPRLRIYAQYTQYDTIKIVNFKNGSLIYNYDDVNDSVQVMSKLYKSNGTNKYKRSTHQFDELGRLVKTKQYKDYNGNYNLFKTNYNYLDMKAKSTDARNLSTKFSYDKFNNPAKTENADASLSLVNTTYTTSAASGFLTTFYSGLDFVNIQELTDETGRTYKKYFDKGGRLLRETKYVSNERSEEDGPFNPDSLEASTDDPGDIPMNTDYKYDSLYRVSCVKTPAGKHIYYNYDKFGRQSKRITPDAGTTYYSYDKNNNLIISQDEKQRSIANNIYTFRTYDGLNRLLTIGETQEGNSNPDFDNVDTNLDPVYDSPGGSNDLLTVNVYDTLTTGPSTIFNNVPSDYTGRKNTKGALVATAFRTRQGAEWNYKFYSYDARGRVVKLWTFIYGLGWKSEKYNYDSQNKITANQYQPDQTDAKSFANAYDFLGRLTNITTYAGSAPIEPSEENDLPLTFEQLATYQYNENSQITTNGFKSGMPVNNYVYNTRNWVASMRSTNSGSTFFEFGLSYNPNGNIKAQYVGGNYKNNFSSTNSLYYNYIYDKSNRLVKADETSISSTEKYFDVVNTFDSDGNLLTMKRYGLASEPQDNFIYTYESGTNKLLGVTKEDEYTYDLNGNITRDKINEVWEMKYDMRNLLISCVSKQPDTDKPGVEPDEIFYSEYTYDEVGNRIRKQIWKYTGSDPEPINNNDAPGDWTMHLNEFYVRNVLGAEVALYKNTNVEFWNIWGIDKIGRLNTDTTKQFYLKDHLGSVRCIINANSEVISAQDFDAWGHLLEGRKFDIGKCKYQFTSKERDIETDYDYFGARYYDSRIARWGGVDPLFEKTIDLSVYTYCANNPNSFIDKDGRLLFLKGPDGQEAFDHLRSFAAFEIRYENKQVFASELSDDEYNKLTIGQQNLYNTIRDPGYISSLVTTHDVYFQTERNRAFFIGGGFNGVYKNEAEYIINLSDFKKMEEMGISSVGKSISHEATEAWMVAKSDLKDKNEAKNLAHYIIVNSIFPEHEMRQEISKGGGGDINGGSTYIYGNFYINMDKRTSPTRIWKFNTDTGELERFK